MPRALPFVVVLVTVALARTPVLGAAPATAMASATQAVDPRWQSLLKRLGDDDFAIRDAAQKELEKTTWRDLPLLRQLADSSADPEVKARLTARATAIDEELLTNPPGITVQFKEASLHEVADQLSAAMGVKLEAATIGQRAAEGYTLSANEQPFWQVFLALSRQHGLQLQDGGKSLRLYAQGDAGWRNGTVVGPLLVLPQSITRQRSSNLQAEPGEELSKESISFMCMIAVDPRLRVIRYSPPRFTSIIDNAGNTLLAIPDASGSLLPTTGRMVFVQSFTTNLALPEKRGTRIASAKGRARFELAAGEQVVEIPEAEKKEGQSFDIGEYSVQITKLTTQNNSTSMSLRLTSPAPAAGRAADAVAPNATSEPTIRVNLTDAADRTMINTTLRGNLSAGMGGAYTPPFKLKLTLPTKTRDVSYPFELKDLPLP